MKRIVLDRMWNDVQGYVEKSQEEEANFYAGGILK
jgi:hypothetical protein